MSMWALPVPHQRQSASISVQRNPPFNFRTPQLIPVSPFIRLAVKCAESQARAVPTPQRKGCGRRFALDDDSGKRKDAASCKPFDSSPCWRFAR